MDCSMLNLNNDEVREEEKEEEETISLSDFQTNADESAESIESSSEVFEFLSDLTCEMSHADDIIFCGKLVPLRVREQPISSIHDKKCFAGDGRKQSGFPHRRCESLSELAGTPRTNSSKSDRGHVRSSRSLDCGKFRRSRGGSGSSEADRRSAAANGESPRLKIQKPRWYWYVLMFGHVKLPPEMALRDIKNRQVRQTPVCRMFPSPDSCSSSVSPVRRNDRRTSWDLLKVLSCNDPASVAVTTSFRCMSQA